MTILNLGVPSCINYSEYNTQTSSSKSINKNSHKIIVIRIAIIHHLQFIQYNVSVITFTNRAMC